MSHPAVPSRLSIVSKMTMRIKTMKARLIPYDVAPNALKPMIELEKALKNSGLEHSLIELVKTRASQINGCAYCIHMHTKDARADRKSTRLNSSHDQIS